MTTMEGIFAYIGAIVSGIAVALILGGVIAGLVQTLKTLVRWFRAQHWIPRPTETLWIIPLMVLGFVAGVAYLPLVRLLSGG